MSRYVYHFVQVTVQHFPIGAKLMREHLEDFDLTDKDYADSDVAIHYLKNQAKNDKEVEKAEYPWTIMTFEPEYELLQDLYGFAFCIIGGPFFNGYNDSPLDFDFREAGAENVICPDDLEILKNHAIELLKQHNETHRHKTDNVSFMAMYQWTSYKDTYHYEWDTESELVGLMTQDRLEKIAGEF